MPEQAMSTPETARPERLLVIVAHPDDADFGVAATVAGWIRQGTVARLVCCTSGDAGGDDPATEPLELARLREQEQLAAAEVVGYEGVDFLHRPDGALANDLALREQLVRIIRRFRPDAVMAMDPTVIILAREPAAEDATEGAGDADPPAADRRSGYVQHVDHRMAAQAALDAVYPAARNPMAFRQLALEEGLDAHAVNRLYLFFSDRPNAWIDVSDTLETKISALRCHASQLRRPDELEEMIRGWAREEGQRLGSAAAESFRIVDIG
ncbi:MAG TPA: PIG-L deacetylase family protein [Candidatus Limnocylindria bacterium]|nr:PIG-L deacetylase family protein [Candidatus Limnocylindria bacterium]